MEEEDIAADLSTFKKDVTSNLPAYAIDPTFSGGTCTGVLLEVTIINLYACHFMAEHIFQSINLSIC